MAKEKESFHDFVVNEFGDIFDNGDGENITAISTGSLSLDVSTGIGGIPLGRLTEIYGPDGAGKTSLGLSIVREAIKLGLSVLYVDTEGALTFPYVNVKDVFTDENKDKFVVIHPRTGDSALDIIEDAINRNEFNLIILDSVAALVIEKELEDNLRDRHIGLLPTLLSSFLRRNIIKIRENNIGLIFLNQVRAKIGSFIQALDSPGGFAMKHFSSLRILVTGGKSIKVNDEVIGNMMNFTIKKNKLSAPFRSFVIPLYYGVGFNYFEDVIKFGQSLGIIKKRGAYSVFDDITLGLGVVKSAKYLEENKEILDKIKDMCYNVLALGNTYIDDTQEGEDFNGE